MAHPLIVNDRVFVPSSAITVRTARSSGPGGQRVNKANTKVDVRVDPNRIEGLSDEARRRLLSFAPLDADGRLHVVRQVHREQGRNLAEAYDKVRELLLVALFAPLIRRKTKPSPAVDERRLWHKRKRAERKRERAWAA